MRFGIVWRRSFKPHQDLAKHEAEIGFVNWRSLRTSRATWMIDAGANPKDVQGQMRHSRIPITLDIYAQCVPDSQWRAIEQTSTAAFVQIWRFEKPCPR